MQNVNHIIYSKWIVTCEDQNKVLQDHALILSDGKIKDILPNGDVDKHYTSSSTHHYSSHAVLPGFINAHTHVPMSFFRGLADDLALMNWLTKYIWPAEKKWLSPELVYDASIFSMAEMIRSGTTCFNDMFFFMPATAKATEKVRMRGHISMHFITFPTNWANDAEEEFEKALAFYDEFKDSKHVAITMAAHSLYTVTEDRYLLRIKEIAEKYDLKINMHVQEPLDEINIIQKQSSMRPLQRLKKLGLLTPRLIAIHMLHVNESDFDLLATCKPNVVHCPESNMKLASGTCPVSELLAKGVNVALGTDGAASNNDLSMLGEMRTAAFLAKYVTKNPESLPADEVLKMATLNGAKALGIDHLTGSLTVGKAADFIAIDLDCIETLPTYHPISHSTQHMKCPFFDYNALLTFYCCLPVYDGTYLYLGLRRQKRA